MNFMSVRAGRLQRMKFGFGLVGVGYGPKKNGLAVFLNPQLVHEVKI